MFDVRKSALILSNGDNIQIDEEDIQCVLNLPRGDIQITESTGLSLDDGPEYLQMLRSWRRRWVGNDDRGAPTTFSMGKRILANLDANDDFKRDFVIFVVSSFLWATQSKQCRFKILKSLMDVDKIKDLNWCRFTLNGLLDSVRKWKTNEASYFHGPLTFLMLCYLDRVADYTASQNCKRQFPILSCWDDKMVSNRIKKEKGLGGFGLGRVLDRISLPSKHNVVEDESEEFEERDELKEPEHSNAGVAAEWIKIADATIQLSRASALIADATQSVMKGVCSDFSFLESSLQPMINAMVKSETLIRIFEFCIQKAKSTQPQPHQTPQNDAHQTPQHDEHQTPEHDEHQTPPIEHNEVLKTDNQIVSIVREHIPEESIEPLSVEIPERQAKFIGKRSQRPQRILPKLPERLKSPYLIQIENELNRLRPLDKCIADLVFSKDQDIKMNLYCCNNISLSRHVLMTMEKDEWLDSQIIDVWAMVMNNHAKLQPKSNKRRLFFSTTPSTYYGIKPKDYNDFLTEELKSLSITNLDIDQADLIFVPLLVSNHFYVAVYNMKNKEIDIIDNRTLPDGIKFENKYEKVPLILKRFMKFLTSKQCEKAKVLSNYKMKFLTLPWQHDDNYSDCGVYTMRHMQEYMGVQKNWDIGITHETAKRKIHFLRMKYLSLIINSETNILKDRLPQLFANLYNLNE